MSTTAIYLTLIFSSFVREQKQRRQIRSAFGQYHVAGAGRAAGAVAGKARARRRGARDDHHVLRRPRLHLDLGDLQERSAGPHRADEPLPDAADQRDPRPQGHHRQIYGRRHHGVLERAARRQGAPDQRLRGRARHAGADRRAQPGARAGGAGRRPRLHSAQCRRRPQHRHLRGRQYGLRRALRLFGVRRQRQSGLAAGRPIQGIRLSDHRRLQDRDGGQGQVRDPRARLHHGEGQEGAGGDLCHRRPRGHRAIRPLPAAAQPDHRDAGLLSRPRLGRRAGRDRARPQERRRRRRWSCSTISTKPASATTRKPRRRKTGTARSRC